MQDIFRLTAILLASLAAGSAALSTQGKKSNVKDFYGVWIEERREAGGKAYTDPFDLLGWELSAKEGGCWLRRGEAVYTGLGKVRIRTDKNPVWLDLIGDKTKVKVGDRLVEKINIRPGIAKRVGKKLIWVWSKDWRPADPKDVADWNTRPKSFEVKKDDPWEKKTLYPGKDRYDTD